MKNLNEDSRNDLIRKSKTSDEYATGNRQFGKNRQQRRLKSRIANSVKEYNQIDMNKLFKEDILDVNIRINGETNNYLVKISFNGFLNSLVKYLPNNATEDNLDFRIILKSLLDAFNHNDVMVHCTCPDFQYRDAYWATVNGTNAGAAETRPSDETNPDDTKGFCKHINLVLNNNSWMMKVAAVINNYIKYMQTHMEKLYQTVIYPAIFDREYVEPEENDDLLDIEDNSIENEIEDNNLIDDEDTIDTSNKWARTKNQFKKGNQSGIQFSKDTNDEPIINNNQKEFNVDSLETNEEN